jgi:hypothetical protein
MKDHATRPRIRARFSTPASPAGYPTHSSMTSATMELVDVPPDEFLRLERLGKRRKRKVTLPTIGILAR